MTARWAETGRPEPREDAGPGATAGCAFLVFAALYLALHALLWVGRVIASFPDFELYDRSHWMMRDHDASCLCTASGHSLMRWTPDDGVYRPSDFDTPLYEPRGSQ